MGKGAWQDWQHYYQTAQNQAKYGSGGTAQDIGHAILGGPAGMVNAALGQKNPVSRYASFSTHLAHSELANDPDGQAIFALMTDDEHNAFENMDGNQRKQFLDSKRAQVKQGQTTDLEEQNYQKWRTEAMMRLDKFSKEMMMSPQELLQAGNVGIQAAQSAGMRAGAMQGLAAGAGGGGISNLNTQKAAMDSMNAFVMPRQQLGLQAQQGMMNFDENRRRYDMEQNLQLQGANMAAYNQQYQQRQQQESGLFGLAGTALGAYFGGPMGAQAGGQLGMAVGGQFYGAQNPYTPPTYKKPTGSGGLGGPGGFGGAQ